MRCTQGLIGLAVVLLAVLAAVVVLGLTSSAALAEVRYTVTGLGTLTPGELILAGPLHPQEAVHKPFAPKTCNLALARQCSLGRTSPKRLTCDLPLAIVLPFKIGYHNILCLFCQTG